MAEAMARCEAAVQADPYCAPAHLTRGNLLLARGMLDEARRAYQRGPIVYQFAQLVAL